MPRLKEDSRTLAADLAARLERLVVAARKEGREQALHDVRALVAGGFVGSPAVARRGPGRPKGSKNKPKPSRKRKSWWATATPAEKAERTRKMLAGRGLKPKGE